MNKIEEQTSQALAAKVVAYRILNLNKEAAIEAMQELSRREANGDTFDYDSYINKKIEEIPSPSMGHERMENLKQTLRNIKNGSI